MTRNKEDNVVFVLQKAVSHLKVKTTNTTVKEFLLAHPHYPSLKSVCDALKKWKVDHYALNLELDEIKALEMPFIAHLKSSGGQLVFVEKIKDEQATYFVSRNKGITENFEKFAEKLSGAVVVMEGNKNSGEKEYAHIRQNEFLNKSLLPLGIITLLVLAVLSFVAGSGSVFSSLGFLFWGLLACKIIGLTASIFLVLHELKVHTPLADKICGFSSITDCDAVLSSNASKLFGWVNWADTGLIFFSGSLTFLLGTSGNNSLWMLAILSALSLPYPVFSIYYQSVKLKKWCPFCLIVQVVLIAEFILLIPSFKTITFSGVDILKLVTAFLIPATIWLIYKAYINKVEEQSSEHFSFLQFKRNPNIFKHLLTSNGYNEFFENENSLVLGNPSAKVTITVFLSLYCKPCANAFIRIFVLLGNSPDFKMNLIFSLKGNKEDEKLINTLYYLLQQKENEKIVEFLHKWYSPIDKSKITRSSDKIPFENLLPQNFDISKRIGIENKKLFEKYKIAGTPTIFISGYKFPTQYDYTDIEYYLDEIINLTRESKRQEACTTCN